MHPLAGGAAVGRGRVDQPGAGAERAVQQAAAGVMPANFDEAAVGLELAVRVAPKAEASKSSTPFE